MEKKGHTSKTLKLPVLWNHDRSVLLFRTEKEAERWAASEVGTYKAPKELYNGLWELKKEKANAVSLDN